MLPLRRIWRSITSQQQQQSLRRRSQRRLHRRSEATNSWGDRVQLSSSTDARIHSHSPVSLAFSRLSLSKAVR